MSPWLLKRELVPVVCKYYQRRATVPCLNTWFLSSMKDCKRLGGFHNHLHLSFASIDLFILKSEQLQSDNWWHSQWQQKKTWKLENDKNIWPQHAQSMDGSFTEAHKPGNLFSIYNSIVEYCSHNGHRNRGIGSRYGFSGTAYVIRFLKWRNGRKNRIWHLVNNQWNIKTQIWWRGKSIMMRTLYMLRYPFDPMQ